MANFQFSQDRGINLADAVTQILCDLTGAGIANAPSEARQLLVDAANLEREDLVLNPHMLLNGKQQRRVTSWLRRRIAGEPLARIRGWQEFYGRRFTVSSATLEPRADSETLIDAALQLLNAQHAPTHPWRFIDVGTGTGCLALTLLAELPNATAVGVDICAQALATAQQNAIALNVADRITWLRSNYLGQVGDTFDLLISNPPYVRNTDIATLQVEVKDHDPHLALAGGADGLDAYRHIAADLPRVIPNGFAVIEFACNDAARVIETLTTGENSHQLKVSSVLHDLAGCERCVALETFS